LGFRQSSFRHITRVPQRLAPYAWARSLLSWHAIVPFTFQIQVSHQTQEPPFEFLPAAPGIQQSASWRTSASPLFRAPRGTHLRAATTDELAILMDQVEQAAARPRPRPRHPGT
jgi:hypothetical protein